MILLVALKLFLAFHFISTGWCQAPTPSRPCTRPGFFEIDDGSCQSYYMCLSNGVALVSYDLKCAGSTVFDPMLESCVSPAAYSCLQTSTPPSTTASTLPTTPSTSAPTTIPSTSAPTLTPSTSAPSTPAPTSTPLTSAPTTTSSTSTSTSAPSTSAPTSPVSTSTARITTTTLATTTQAACVISGRFPDKSDTTCKKYYFCVVDGTTVIEYDNLRCPNTLLFHPTLQKCVLPSMYKCP